MVSSKIKYKGKSSAASSDGKTFIGAFDAAVAAEVMLQRLVVGNDLAEYKKIVLADPARVLAYGIAKNRRGARLHMFDGIDAKTVDVGERNPMFVGLDQRVQNVCAPDVEFLQTQEIAVDRLLGIAPVTDLAAPLVALTSVAIPPAKPRRHFEIRPRDRFDAKNQTRREPQLLWSSNKENHRDKPNCRRCDSK